MYKDLIFIFEKRKKDLLSNLKQRSSDIGAGKQHQMFGAIKELEMVLSTLNKHQGYVAGIPVPQYEEREERKNDSTTGDLGKDPELAGLTDIRQS